MHLTFQKKKNISVFHSILLISAIMLGKIFSQIDGFKNIPFTSSKNIILLSLFYSSHKGNDK